MSLRPAQARWFETYVPGNDTLLATKTLANTGVVQLELDPRPAQPVDVDRLRHFVDRFRALAAEHAHDLPKAGKEATSLLGDPAHLADQALHRLMAWSARIDHAKAHLEQLREALRQHELLADCMETMRESGLDLTGVFRKTRFLFKSIYSCPKGLADISELDSSLETVVRGKRHDFLYIADLSRQRQVVRDVLQTKGCEQLGIPAWLSDSSGQPFEQMQRHLTRTRNDVAQLEAELKALRHDSEMAGARANIDTLHWYLVHASGHLSGSTLCHITGWTTALDLSSLQQALRKANIKAVVRFPDPPIGLSAPVTILDTWWSRPFQPLLGFWGTPGRAEVDPSAVLAVIVPLLFGYMFPDVGHGLVLVSIALLAWRRQPRLRFLLPCGLAAMGFGLLFGDVFGLHNLIPPLWLSPMDEPLQVLAVPLLFGAGLMLLGLVFAGIEAHWRGELGTWLLLDGAVLLLYASSLLGLVWDTAFWGTLWAMLQYSLASLLLPARGKGGNGFLGSMGALLLSLFELAINTLSFLRVGAFALGHAALSFAVLSLAEGTSSPLAWALVMVLGNLFSIVLEGLLVMVQTTRLVLFEFFMRFLSTEGRLFRPIRRQTTGG